MNVPMENAPQLIVIIVKPIVQKEFVTENGRESP
jgi:hypothetical protein